MKEIIEESIQFYSSEDCTFTFSQFKHLLKSIRGESSNAPANYPMQIWKFLNSSLHFNIPANYVHDFLLIIFGSLTFNTESASSFLVRHLQQYGFSNWNEQGLSKARVLIRESRKYFKDRIAYIPIGHFKELTLNDLHLEQNQYSFRPDIHLKTWNKAKERSLVERLSKKKSVNFKIDTENTKLKEREQYSHRSKLSYSPEYLHSMALHIL
eukprot:TRINITY_DN9681_c0_g7_i1.p1 TRINITY_DN9681_c0_g7~~TRINITY_DN9681_c0_g7_i1.p1  ORF type:complete len:211 (-),score=3.41 TRINITY_DN9681_c0_g7_i1:184-816(-)